MTLTMVKPDLIRWARERARLEAGDLETAFPKYRLWESGEASPTMRQLEALARKTFTPLGYFFLPEPPDEELPIPDYRTVHDARREAPSPNLLETIQRMQQRQAWMHDHLVEEGQSPLPFVGSVTLHSDPNTVAASIRATLGLRDGWAQALPSWTDALRTLRLAAEDAGVLVVVNGIVGNDTHRSLDVEEFRGFVLIDPYAPLVFVNGSDAKAAQMFTLAHEIAHVWLGEEAVFDLEGLQPSRHAVERFCNIVAAETLVPEVDLRAVWPQARRDPKPIQAIARRFKVSPLVAARRALDLRLLGRDAFFDFYREYEADEQLRAERAAGGGDFYANQFMRVGRRFGRAVVDAAREGRLPYREAYELTGLRGTTFDRFADELAEAGR